MANPNETVCQKARRLAAERLAKVNLIEAAHVIAAGAGAMVGLVSTETLTGVLDRYEEQKPIIAPNAIDYGG
jgi:hypothetical protein